MKVGCGEEALVEAMFEAAIHPELWPDILTAVSDHVAGGPFNVLCLGNADERPLFDCFVRGDRQGYETYLSDYILIDPRIPRLEQAPVGKVLLEHDVLSEAELRTDVAYNECLSRWGMRNLAQGNLSSGDVFTGFALAPRNDRNPFTSEQVAAISRLMTPLRQATRVTVASLELQQQRQTLGDLWSLSGKGVLILDRHGAVLFANRLAEEHMRGGTLLSHTGHLSFADPAAQRRWRKQLDLLAGDKAPRFSEFLTPCFQQPCDLAVRVIIDPALPSRLAPVSRGRILMLITPMTNTLDLSDQEVRRFAQLFSISPAECRAIGAIARGETLDDLARCHGVSEDTVRKQLKSAMGKCGVSSQKALISRLERFCFLSRSL